MYMYNIMLLKKFEINRNLSEMFFTFFATGKTITS